MSTKDIKEHLEMIKNTKEKQGTLRNAKEWKWKGQGARDSLVPPPPLEIFFVTFAQKMSTKGTFIYIYFDVNINVKLLNEFQHKT